MCDNKSNDSTKNSLQFVAATINHLLAELEDPERLASLLDAEVEHGWPPGEYDRDAQEFFRDRIQDGGIAVVGWYSWYAIRRGDHKQRSVVVGAGGYFGPPNENGEVEIGFSIVSTWQRMGYATETAEFLVDRAFSDIRVCKVIAHTTHHNVASCKVLEKAGFKVNGVDEKTGSVYFEILRNRWLHNAAD